MKSLVSSCVRQFADQRSTVRGVWSRRAARALDGERLAKIAYEDTEDYRVTHVFAEDD
jgi:hypothetical protein